MGEMDYTYAERMNRDTTGGHYKDDLYQKTADAVVVELNYETPPYDADFTIGAEAANVINVSLQLKDVEDAAFEEATVLSFWLCSDPEGETPAAADTSVAATVGGLLEELTALTSYTAVTDVNGELAIDIEHSADASFYLTVVLPNGKKIVSGEIDFD